MMKADLTFAVPFAGYPVAFALMAAGPPAAAFAFVPEAAVVQEPAVAISEVARRWAA